MSNWQGQPGGYGTPHGAGQHNSGPHGYGPGGQPGFAGPAGQNGAAPYGNPQFAAQQPGYGAPFGAMPPQPQDVRPGIMSLRPNDVGELIGVAFRGVGSAFWSILALEFLVALIPGILVVIAFISFVSSNPTFDETQADTWVNLGGVVTLLVIALLLVFVLSLISQGAIIKVFAERVLGRRARVWRCFGAGLRHMFPILGLGILIGLVYVAMWIPLIILIAAGASNSSNSDQNVGAVIGLVFLYLPFMGLLLMWLFVKWSYAPYIIVMEEVGPIKALGRSWHLTKGRWWSIFGTYLLAYIVVFAVTLALQLVMGLVSGIFTAAVDQHQNGGTVALGVILAAIAMVCVVVVNMMVGPFMMNVQGASYLDTRIRKENLAPALAAAAGAQSEPMTGHYMPAPGPGGYPPRPY